MYFDSLTCVRDMLTYRYILSTELIRSKETAICLIDKRHFVICILENYQRHKILFTVDVYNLLSVQIPPKIIHGSTNKPKASKCK